MEEIQVQNNEAASRFEVTRGVELAVLDYRRQGNQIVLVHTGVPPALEGQGVGSALAKTALEFARQNGLVVVPQCPFVRAYLKRHPEYNSLLAPGWMS